jgi:hypothetical protein
LVFIGFHWFSLVFIGFHWFSLVFIGFHWFSLVFIGFHWICADYHVYQNSIIHSKSEPKLNITQWIFGTGGGELDELVEDSDLDTELFSLKILPNIVFDSKGADVSYKFNDAKGLNRFGYGEITFNLCSTTHKFILSDHDYSLNKKGGEKTMMI